MKSKCREQGRKRKPASVRVEKEISMSASGTIEDTLRPSVSDVRKLVIPCLNISYEVHRLGSKPLVRDVGL